MTDMNIWNNPAKAKISKLEELSNGKSNINNVNLDNQNVTSLEQENIVSLDDIMKETVEIENISFPPFGTISGMPRVIELKDIEIGKAIMKSEMEENKRIA